MQSNPWSVSCDRNANDIREYLQFVTVTVGLCRGLYCLPRPAADHDRVNLFMHHDQVNLFIHLLK